MKVLRAVLALAWATVATLLLAEVGIRVARPTPPVQVVRTDAALQVDLFGQANASRINARIHSGFGGQTDFIVGALHSEGGQAILALCLVSVAVGYAGMLRATRLPVEERVLQ